MEVLNDNFITIQGWMRTELNLTGNDLMVYAIIYGFSQDKKSEFYASQEYLADWCGCTTRGIRKNLDSLISKGLIQIINRPIGQTVHYRALRLPINSVDRVGTKFQGDRNIVPRGVELSSGNNISNTKIDIDNTIPKGIVGETPTPNENTSDNSQLSEYEQHMFEDDVRQKRKITQPKQKKLSLWDKCMQAIEEYTDDINLREALTEYLKLRLEIKDKPIYANQWKGLLNKLQTCNGDPVKIVRQSIELGYASFYDLKTWNNRGGKPNPSTFGETASMSSQKVTDEEWEDMMKNGEKF